MALTVAQMRTFLRVSGDAFDDEIQLAMDAAEADMSRVGIVTSQLEDSEYLYDTAIVCYVKAAFGFDNPDAPMFQERYRQIVTDLLNSAANVAAGED